MFIKAFNEPYYMTIWCGGPEEPAVEFFMDYDSARVRYKEHIEECTDMFEMVLLYEVYIDDNLGRVVKTKDWYVYEEYIPVA